MKCIFLSLAVNLLVSGTLLSPIPEGGEVSVPRQFPTIQAAIDASSAGDTILVEPGIYSEQIVLKPGVTVRSVGDDQPGDVGLKRAEAVILDGSSADEARAGVQMAEGAILDGLTVRHIGKYDEELWQRHAATAGNDQSYDEIGAPGVAGISVPRVSCTVRNNIVHHIGYSGIAIAGGDESGPECVIEGNICYRNMGGGIAVMRNGRAILQDNSCYENFYAGIGFHGASAKVIGNKCYENIRAGIGISEGSSPEIRGNRCFRNRRAGIGVRTGEQTAPLIVENECFENGMAGIGARDHARPVIRGNRCYRNAEAGVGISSGAAPEIIGNECFENKQVGIGQSGDTRAMIRENRIHHNVLVGIGFAEGGTGSAQLINNRVTDNGKPAIGIHGGWNVELTGNHLAASPGMPPVVMVYQGAEATFRDNIIEGQGVAGIRVAGTVTVIRNVIRGRVMRKVGPPNFAVWGLPGAKVTMKENQVSGWRHALHASQAEVKATSNTVSDYYKTALVVIRPTSDPVIRHNVGITIEEGAQVATVDQEAFGEDSNSIRRSEEEDSQSIGSEAGSR